MKNNEILNRVIIFSILFGLQFIYYFLIVKKRKEKTDKEISKRSGIQYLITLFEFTFCFSLPIIIMLIIEIFKERFKKKDKSNEKTRI